MNPLKELILLKNLGKAGFHISITGQIPDDIDSITKVWFDRNINSNGISFSDFIIFLKNAEEEYNKTRYTKSRESFYPSVQEQLDMIYWDKVNGTNKWKEAIDLIKNKFPKE